MPKQYAWISMAVAFLATHSVSLATDADSIAFRLRNVAGEEMAEDSILSRIKNDVRRLQGQFDKSPTKPLSWRLGLAEGYRHLIWIHSKEIFRMERLKDSAGADSARTRLEVSTNQMNGQMRELWVADSNNIEVMRQFLVINQDRAKDIEVYNRLVGHPKSGPGDKQNYLSFLSSVQDTSRFLSLASKCEMDTMGITSNHEVEHYILFCAETLEQFNEPKAAIRLYDILAKANPGEFKAFADRAILRLISAGKK